MRFLWCAVLACVCVYAQNTAVVIVSDGRSGSTLLAHTVEHIVGASGNTASLFAEPFRNYGADRRMAPHYSFITSCKWLLNETATQYIAWEFLCVHWKTVTQLGLQRDCKHKTLAFIDRMQLYKHCMESDFRILKTIRASDVGLIAWGPLCRKCKTRFIFGTRNPGRIARSQLLRGWKSAAVKNCTTPRDVRLLFKETVRERCLARIKMRAMVDAVAGGDEVLTVTHDDLSGPQSADTMNRIATFLGVPFNATLRIPKQRYATIKETRNSIAMRVLSTLSSKAMSSVVKSVPECAWDWGLDESDVV